MFNVFKYEFKMYRSSVLIWSLSFMAMIVIFMSFYPAFGTDTEIMDKMLANYPEEFLKAFGMASGLPLSSVYGYFVFIYVFIQLCLAIQAGNYGFSILSVEERELTADFLMSKPVGRNEILVSKITASILALILTNVFVVLSTYFALKWFNNDKPYEFSRVMILLYTNFAFQMVFFSIGLLISTSIRKLKSVLTFSLALAFGTYTLNAIRSIIGGKLLGYFSPFYYFEAGYILEHGKYDIPMLVLSSSIILVSLITTYVLYMKRDIYSL